MTARFSSECPECGKRIKAGRDEVARRNGKWAHADCRRASGSETAREPQRPEHDWSNYQLAVFDFVERGDGHGVVDAVAGSGKSTTLEEAVRRASDTGQQVGVAAFSKKIATAMQGRLPAGIAEVATLHSLGLRSLPNRPKIVTNKALDIMGGLAPIRDAATKDEAERNRVLWRPVLSLVSLAKATLASREDYPKLIERYSISLNGASDALDRVYDLTDKVLRISKEQAGIADFDDMIWLPVVLDVRPERFDILFVDETQDLNAAQVDLALRFIKPGGRIIAVGDPDQSIFGFRGADTEAMPRLIETLDATVLPLSITYRCPWSHVELAQSLVPRIEAAPGAKEGEIRDLDADALVGELEEGDMVLCRTNAPLIHPVYACIRAGKRARINDADFGKGLLQLIDKILSDGKVDALLEKLARYHEQEVIKLRKTDRSTTSLDEKVETIVALSDGVLHVSEIKDRVRSLFHNVDAEDASRWITFSSVHRAKGLEADRVYILRPDLLPLNLTKDWEVEQEKNIQYVAYTRSKDVLTFVKGEPGGGNPERVVRHEEREEEPVPEPAQHAPVPEPAPKPLPASKPGPLPVLISTSEVGASGLPAYPDKGDGSYCAPTLDDWDAIATDYRDAGCTAVVMVPGPRWKQYALIVSANGRMVRVSTTVTTGGTRKKGANAIDIVRVTALDGKPVGGRKKVLRTQGWEGRVAHRINSLLT